jgi:hypothetical protein
MVIERIIREHHLHGSEFVAFGDGFVEIEDAKAVGGIAVGVASNEATRSGVNTRKRTRLIQAGADIIITLKEAQDFLSVDGEGVRERLVQAAIRAEHAAGPRAEPVDFRLKLPVAGDALPELGAVAAGIEEVQFKVT